jgi:hypothetical protein
MPAQRSGPPGFARLNGSRLRIALARPQNVPDPDGVHELAPSRLNNRIGIDLVY